MSGNPVKYYLIEDLIPEKERAHWRSFGIEGTILNLAFETEEGRVLYASRTHLRNLEKTRELGKTLAKRFKVPFVDFTL